MTVMPEQVRLLVRRSLAGAPGGPWPLRRATLVGVGGLLGIAAVGALGFATGAPLLVAPLGSTCMMIFGAPEAPFARPRNVIGGHLICSVTGLVALSLLGGGFAAIALAVGLAMAAMGLTRTFHPPAGGDVVLVMLTAPGWWFPVLPILAGCLVLLLVAGVFRRATRVRQ